VESIQQGPRARFAFFWGIHHVHQLLGGPPEVLQLLPLLLILLAQRFDLLKAIDELWLFTATPRRCSRSFLTSLDPLDRVVAILLDEH
jgi:hypothetical protein